MVQIPPSPLCRQLLPKILMSKKRHSDQIEKCFCSEFYPIIAGYKQKHIDTHVKHKQSIIMGNPALFPWPPKCPTSMLAIVTMRNISMLEFQLFPLFSF